MADLTNAVYRRLKITWVSEGTMAEVEDIMSRAEIMLDDLLGAELVFDDSASGVSGRDLDLYLNLCLYLYNGLTESEFIEAYRESLIIARQQHVDPINTDAEESDEDS